MDVFDICGMDGPKFYGHVVQFYLDRDGRRTVECEGEGCGWKEQRSTWEEVGKCADEHLRNPEGFGEGEFSCIAHARHMCTLCGPTPSAVCAVYVSTACVAHGRLSCDVCNEGEDTIAITPEGLMYLDGLTGRKWN